MRFMVMVMATPESEAGAPPKPEDQPLTTKNEQFLIAMLDELEDKNGPVWWQCTLAQVHDNLVILDLRNEDTIWAGNRFVIYALVPQCNISCHVLWGKNKQNTVFAVGKSILKRDSKTHVGKLMLEYGGGGHEAAGTCQVENLRAEEQLQTLIDTITADG